ncbi:hypothetical protein FB451DRAFT_463552 [Mycena latifolia]|nr:hypothetical protein FB451DRAFT_463552 [Mycena latifolia]
MLSRSLLRPLQAHTRRLPRSSYSTHTSDSYSKDVDSSPPSDSKIHRVDPSSENVQKPHEPPSGKWSATGVDAGVKNAQGKRDGEAATGMKEYKTMSGEPGYKAPGEEQHDGKPRNPLGSGTSASGEGPAGSESGGRKPEGR